jgi:hypothetical protein
MAQCLISLAQGHIHLLPLMWQTTFRTRLSVDDLLRSYANADRGKRRQRHGEFRFRASNEVRLETGNVCLLFIVGDSAIMHPLCGELYKIFYFLYWRCNPVWVLVFLRGSVTVKFLVVGSLAHAEPPTWRTRDYTSSIPYPLTFPAWAALPGAYAPVSIALRVSGARKSLHDKVVVLKEAL